VVPHARDRKRGRVVADRYVQPPPQDGPDAARHLQAAPSCRTRAVAATQRARGRERESECFEQRLGRTVRAAARGSRAGTHSSPTKAAVRPISKHGHTVPSMQMRLSFMQSYSPRSSGLAALSSPSSAFHASPIGAGVPSCVCHRATAL
jgi:hypothetical protein